MMGRIIATLRVRTPSCLQESCGHSVIGMIRARHYQMADMELPDLALLHRDGFDVQSRDSKRSAPI